MEYTDEMIRIRTLKWVNFESGIIASWLIVSA